MPTNRKKRAEREYRARLEQDYYEFCEEFPHRFFAQTHKVGSRMFSLTYPSKVIEWIEFQGIGEGQWAYFNRNDDHEKLEIGFKNEIFAAMARIRFG